MAFAVIMTVAWLAVAGVVGTDYSEARMPQYGSREEYDERASAAADDEYRDHSPDAAATLDYKLNDESNGKKKALTVDDIDEEKWEESKLKKVRSVYENDLDNNLNKYNGDAIGPKLKPKYRLKNQRSRLSDRDNDENNKFRQHRKRRRNSEENMNDPEKIKDDFQINNLLFGNERSPEEPSNVKPDDEDRYKSLRRTTETFARLYIDKDKRENNDDRNVGKLRRRKTKEMDYPIEKAHRGRRPDIYDSRSSQPRKNSRDIYENYDEYDDYYDTKRFHTVENKFSNLRSRKKARMAPAPPTGTIRSPRRRGARTSWRSTKRPSRVQSLLTKQTVSTKSTVIRHKKTTTTTATPSTAVDSSEKTSKNLPLAELSRLSILRKAQKKERSNRNVTTTKKPPVLLQVTDKINTFIMVEPASSSMPWMRAVEVSDDMPDRLEKVKSLMRHKLVANARDMRDLTDNWDEMICDYIDMSLLKNQSVCAQFTLQYFALFYIFCTFLNR